ncbi:rhomboid family protein [Treponema primitia ZAS-2]|uniref:Rhomboid family protein n=1 Tax=Treponema primitia (strain ATCC BAA-887 / DSM 12427 / ZAS-2) TaxID=545694 RepID=F5YM51_TREPZ|nr:rhomboid family intramembrane serine protease [Treponema primitia]AEF84332.1 rhomboid family protein [Treponema primitia ZAS-2]
MNLIQRPFRYRYDNTMLFIVGINVLIFVMQMINPRITYYLALNPILIRNGFYWQFLTYMFAHGSITHILFNMLALFFFGAQVERRMGSKEFLLYYLVTGVLAGVLSFCIYWFTGAYMVQLMGASGALFAVQLAYATFFPDSMVYLWGILPLRAPVMVLGFTALELFSSVFGFRSGVAHLTHLAGFAFGWLYFLVRFNANPWKYLTQKNK